MKNVLKYSVVGLIFTFGIIVSVLASSTAWLNAPATKTGSIAKGPRYSLQSDSPTIRGSDVTMSFSDFNNLPAGFAIDSSRIVNAVLSEYDLLSTDEVVLQYIGHFNGLTLTSFGTRNLVNPGNLEDIGDNTGEFYLESLISKKTGDPTSSTGILYKYKILVNEP